MSHDQFDRNRQFNVLLSLLTAPDVETAMALKKAISSSRAKAKLKGMAERMGVLMDQKIGREVHFINGSLFTLLTQ